MISDTLKVLSRTLGEKHPSDKILRSIVEIGSGFVETQSYVEGDYYWEFFTEGVTFNFSEERLVQITLYILGSGMYSPFKTSVFLNAENKEIDEEKAISLLGKYIDCGGDETGLLGYVNKWYKYLFESTFIILEFDKTNKLLSKIHLTT